MSSRLSFSLALVLIAAGGCNESEGPTRSAASVAVPATASPPPTTGPTTAPAADAVATIGRLTVTRDDLDRILYRSYGISLLADLVELDLAKDALAKHGLTLTDADVADERQRSMVKLFPNDKPENYAADLKQLEATKHLTDAEFDLGFQTTAALRKLARPQVAGQVSDASVHQAFEILYGANRVISDIKVPNVLEVAEVHRRLAAGEPWGTVVREMSIDPRTREANGEWPPFSAKTPGVPPAIMEAAFGMHVGDVSKEPIVEGSQYHVIKLLGIIPPKVVKYDDVKADVRAQVEEQLVQSAVNQFRDQLKSATLAGLTIDDPTLRQSWDAMIAAQSGRPGRPSPPPRPTNASTRRRSRRRGRESESPRRHGGTEKTDASRGSKGRPRMARMARMNTNGIS